MSIEIDLRKSPVRHGLTKTPEYFAWRSMRHRCLNPKDKAYHKYGGRGISISPRWESFLAFLNDMGPRPMGKSLDRIDNQGGYSKENCRWATRFEQTNNRRTNSHIFLYGQKYTVSELARKYGLTFRLLRDRLNSGWDIRDALLCPTSYRIKE